MVILHLERRSKLSATQSEASKKKQTAAAPNLNLICKHRDTVTGEGDKRTRKLAFLLPTEGETLLFFEMNNRLSHEKSQKRRPFRV
ncbi:unnamed protein product [Caenorhabditis auriculariae]|uniref:Uncharacterized protein n=1 Tax=Caenorhabditis auriculariae TaxID=2777116 RepID=A0A8S1HSP1_9PELO|nr:unnamed protein product [Caenorhabditis auriculariae]